ncbi:soluble lytic murein transglycosylase-like protein [Pararhizobium capsulatum DSM 1112]|uniref:Soluble lytic murein transglycosylase-like protein n=1 Tax=Pararhizobium capsulatum DSM 1112 TaxID=1121113 RepID=A0ABU0BTX2_9HYPH|nr:soluble lytic murein transglycosylase-like protein [Pararhizobium capsulatum DSM 1112]
MFGATLAISVAPTFTPVAAQSEWQAPPCIYSTTTAKTTLCVRAKNYSRDICAALGHFAEANALPPDFFARLIWKESLFRPDAVSPKGAEGIAQFIPSTAKLRGLSNSFDALEALGKSAEYLDALRDRFGNLGLAAVAYNAGEGGLGTFLRTGNLPYETRAYVLAITAHPAEEWKDNPPQTLDLRLDKDKSFYDACTALADKRQLKEIEFEEEGTWAPWGAQLAAHFQKSVAQRLFLTTISRTPAPLNAEKPLIQRERNARFGTRLRYTARIGRDTRAEADAVCVQVHRTGGACIVFKN